MGVDIIIKGLLRMSGVSGYSQIAQSTISIISAIMALALLVNCFFGYKLIRLQIALSGFAIGGILGMGLSVIIFGSNAGLDGLIIFSLIGGILFAIVGALLANKVFKIGLFIYASSMPIIISFLIGIAIGEMEITVVGIIIGVIFGILGVILARPYFIAITAIGSGFMAGPLVLATFGVYNVGGGILIGGVLAIAGVLVQWATTGVRREELHNYRANGVDGEGQPPNLEIKPNYITGWIGVIILVAGTLFFSVGFEFSDSIILCILLPIMAYFVYKIFNGKMNRMALVVPAAVASFYILAWVTWDGMEFAAKAIRIISCVLGFFITYVLRKKQLQKNNTVTSGADTVSDQVSADGSPVTQAKPMERVNIPSLHLEKEITVGLIGAIICCAIKSIIVVAAVSARDEVGFANILTAINCITTPIVVCCVYKLAKAKMNKVTIIIVLLLSALGPVLEGTLFWIAYRHSWCFHYAYIAWNTEEYIGLSVLFTCIGLCLVAGFIYYKRKHSRHKVKTNQSQK